MSSSLQPPRDNASISTITNEEADLLVSAGLPVIADLRDFLPSPRARPRYLCFVE